MADLADQPLHRTCDKINWSCRVQAMPAVKTVRNVKVTACYLCLQSASAAEAAYVLDKAEVQVAGSVVVLNNLQYHQCLVQTTHR